MAVFTVSLQQASGAGDISLGDGTTLATLGVSAGRGPKGDGFTGGTYNASTGVVTFTSNDGIGFSTGDLRADLSEPGPIGDVTPNTGAFTSLSTTGDAVIGGDLTVNGTTTTINTQTLDVEDKNITIAFGAPDAASADGAGLTVDGANATFTYVSSGDNWAFNKDVDVTGDITVTGTVDGRDVATDGSKLDGIEAGADVTDTANVTVAGALMDSELTDEAAVKALDQGVATTDSPSFAGLTATTAEINGGTIDGTVIGGSTPAAGTFTNTELAAIAETKADTAVDVFVYDTSKDSDGGAWRQRTQGTSWYNETLNTATRGSRREFPAVAVIVAEANKVTIYDGDDPSLPMWMVFDAGTDYFIFASPSLSSVFMLNGVLCVGDSSFDLYTANILSDEMKRYLDSSTITWSNGIVDRNSAMTIQSNPAGGLINRVVNDVAMTVLPDAPIDPATGIQRVTIACATDGGVSVIKDDGTVVDSDITQVCDNVQFANEGLWFTDTLGSDLNFATYADVSSGDGFGDRIAQTNWGGSDFDLLSEFGEFVVAGGVFAGGDDRNIEDSVLGLTLHQPNYTDQAKGMSALLTSTYNTGWMNGDIKGAFLSDTDDTDLVGSGELVTNGTFDTDTSGWSQTAGVTSFSVVGGEANVTTDGAFKGVFQTISTTIGEVYVLSLDLVSSSTPIYVDKSDNSTFGSNQKRITPSAAGSYTLTFEATASTTYISFRSSSADTFIFDNISVKLADEDRSVNNNGLIVNGTVTRSPVATGADLVAYSGFSASNYLEQPYNPDLDFGTGDACYMGWVKPSGNGWYFVRGPEGVNDPLGLRQLNGTLTASIGGTALSGGSIPDGVWAHVALIRKSGVAYIYANGEEVASISATASLDGSDYILRLGIKVSSLANNFDGSLALWRISATAPTAEQIAKIYEDEKFLFQENAGAVLAGTSDAVTALAYDEDTQELLVGTSQNTSVFRGLRRVETIAGSASAISASNGLRVIED